MYSNLKAEMARSGITVKDVSLTLNKTEKSVRSKLAGIHDFTLRDTTLIRDAFFPGFSIDELFVSDRPGKKA